MAIPFIIGGAAALLGGKGVVDHIDASDNFDRAESINKEAQEIADRATNRAKNAKQYTNGALEELGGTKLEIMGGSINNFVAVFSKIKNIRYENNIGFEELRNFTPDSSEFNSLRTASYNAANLVNDGLDGLKGGALAAVGAYGAVGALGTASTGAAIAGLSGAAATNATLAWLGGGSLAAGGFGMAGGAAVLGGIVLAPLLAITGSARKAKSEAALNDARSNREKAQKYEQEVKNACSVMNAISNRAEQIQNLLSALDSKFSIAVHDVKNVIEFFGTNWNEYNVPAKKKVGIAAQLAKTMKIIIDTPLLKENGELNDYESGKALETGRVELNKF